jgi:tetratricopeptide (TPR) repeat protein
MAAFGDKATADMWVYAAQAHRNNGTLEMAEDVVNLALSHYPSNYRLAREKAELMLAKGDWAQAAKHWQALLDHFPDRSSGRDLARISKRLRENGEIYSAEALTARGMAVHSDDLDLSKEFAEVATAQKKWPEAIERWRVVLRAQGDSAPARVYFRLGQSLRRNGNIDSACSVVRQGMAIWPDDASLVKELDHLASISRTA